MSVDVDVDVDVDADVSPGGGGGVAPGECIVPANTDRPSAMLRIATAHVRRNGFTLGLLLEVGYKIFCIRKIMQSLLYRTLEHNNFSCKSASERVRFAGSCSFRSI